MLGGNRSAGIAHLGGFGVIAAILLCCSVVGVLAFSEGRQAEQEHQKAKAATERANGANERPQQSDTNHAGVPAFAQRLISNPEPTSSDEREKRDLAAQENTAAWAFWVALLSSGQLILSGLGLLALLETIKQGRLALAKASDANEISNRIAEAELRPYLFVEKIDLIKTVNETREVEQDGKAKRVPGLFCADVEMHFRNYGKVPARNIRIFKRRYLARFHRGRIYNFHSSEVATPVCAPGHERRIFDWITIFENDRADFDEGLLEYVIRLRYSYEDDSGRVFKDCADYRLVGNDLKTFYLLLGPHDIRQARASWQQYVMEFGDPDQQQDSDKEVG